MRNLMICTAAIALAVLLGACGGSKSTDTGSGESPPPSSPLSSSAENGKQIAAGECSGCHSDDGTSRSGPTWKGLAGSEVKLANGSTVTADDAYLTKAIADPSAEVVSGFNGNSMSLAVPKGSLSDQDVKDLVAYIDSLK